jgi:hypothetical protein
MMISFLLGCPFVPVNLLEVVELPWVLTGDADLGRTSKMLSARPSNYQPKAQLGLSLSVTIMMALRP